MIVTPSLEALIEAVPERFTGSEEVCCIDAKVPLPPGTNRFRIPLPFEGPPTQTCWFRVALRTKVFVVQTIPVPATSSHNFTDIELRYTVCFDSLAGGRSFAQEVGAKQAHQKLADLVRGWVEECVRDIPALLVDPAEHWAAFAGELHRKATRVGLNLQVTGEWEKAEKAMGSFFREVPQFHLEVNAIHRGEQDSSVHKVTFLLRERFRQGPFLYPTNAGSDFLDQLRDQVSSTVEAQIDIWVGKQNPTEAAKLLRKELTMWFAPYHLEILQITYQSSASASDMVPAASPERFLITCEITGESVSVLMSLRDYVAWRDQFKRFGTTPSATLAASTEPQLQNALLDVADQPSKLKALAEKYLGEDIKALGYLISSVESTFDPTNYLSSFLNERERPASMRSALCACKFPPEFSAVVQGTA